MDELGRFAKCAPVDAVLARDHEVRVHLAGRKRLRQHAVQRSIVVVVNHRRADVERKSRTRREIVQLVK